MTKIRLQKLLSETLGSRRKIETLILEGKIKVNGTCAKLGDVADKNDRITIEGKVVVLKQKTLSPRVILYHKRVGEICSNNDPKHKNSVYDYLPKINTGRWIMVGRLDLNTSGLLLFTNDGDFAHKLMHPSSSLEREYAVRVFGDVQNEHINNLLKGVTLDDGTKASFKSIVFKGSGRDAANGWYHVVLTEGKNREVRKLFATQGLEVSRLIRVRFGNILLPRWLVRGKTVELTKQQIKELFNVK